MALGCYAGVLSTCSPGALWTARAHKFQNPIEAFTLQVLMKTAPSSAGASGALDKLAGMGFNAGDFVGAVTSGEVTHQQLQERAGPFWRGLGRRCLHFTWGTRGAVSLEGLGLEVSPCYCALISAPYARPLCPEFCSMPWLYALRPAMPRHYTSWGSGIETRFWFNAPLI